MKTLVAATIQDQALTVKFLPVDLHFQFQVVEDTRILQDKTVFPIQSFPIHQNGICQTPIGCLVMIVGNHQATNHHECYKARSPQHLLAVFIQTLTFRRVFHHVVILATIADISTAFIFLNH